MGLTFGGVIAECRAEKELTQKELTQKVLIKGKPITTAYLSDIENDRRSPQSDHLIDQFSSALDLDPDYLHYLWGRFPVRERRELLGCDDFRKAMEAFRDAVSRNCS